MNSHQGRVRRGAPAARFLTFSLLTCWCGALADTVPQAVRVSNPQQFKSAVEDGEAHIVITDHLNLDGLTPVKASKPYNKLLRPPETTRSITVSFLSLRHDKAGS